MHVLQRYAQPTLQRVSVYTIVLYSMRIGEHITSLNLLLCCGYICRELHVLINQKKKAREFFAQKFPMSFSLSPFAGVSWSWCPGTRFSLCEMKKNCVSFLPPLAHSHIIWLTHTHTAHGPIKLLAKEWESRALEEGRVGWEGCQSVMEMEYDVFKCCPRLKKHMLIIFSGVAH